MAKKRKPAPPVMSPAPAETEVCEASSVAEAVTWFLRPVAAIMEVIDRAQASSGTEPAIVHVNGVRHHIVHVHSRALLLTDWCLHNWGLDGLRKWPTIPPAGMRPEEGARLNAVWRNAQAVSSAVHRLFRPTGPHVNLTVTPDRAVLASIRSHRSELLRLAGCPEDALVATEAMAIADGAVGARTAPHARSLAANHRAARDLRGHLCGVLDWFEAIRAADQNKPPKVLPWWWDGYMQDHDWKMLGRDDHGPATNEGRLRFLQRKIELAVHRLTSDKDGIWAKLVDPIPVAPEDKYIFAACKESLRNLDGLLCPATNGLRMKYCVIPDEKHLEWEMPGVWDPERETDDERQADTRIARAAYDKIKATDDEKPRAERRLKRAKVLFNRLRNERDERNRLGAQKARRLGLVSSERYRELLAARARTQDEIERWRLGEADVRRAVEYLEADPAARSRPSKPETPPAAKVVYVDSATLKPAGWTTGELAKAAGCSERTMRRLIERLQEEGLESGPPGVSTWRYPVADVQFMVERLTASTRKHASRYAANLQRWILNELPDSSGGDASA